MKLTVTEILADSALEMNLNTRSVEMHSRMQQLSDSQKDTILRHINDCLKGISHYILLNTKKPE